MERTPDGIDPIAALRQAFRPSIADARPQFRRFRGACLQWQHLGHPHGRFRLLVSGLPRGQAEILFLYTRYVECPIMMRNVRLRVATDQERERVRGFQMSDRTHPIDALGCLAIDHDAGIGYIAAGMMFVHWAGDPGGLP